MATVVRYRPFESGYQNVYIDKSKPLGHGSYGAVYKAKCDELPCAAKVLHPTILSSTDPGADIIMWRFRREMSFLEHIRHPNIVQYLSMTRDPESRLPVLVMELLDESLTEMLERSQQSLAYRVQVDICYDITLALVYLHSNKIIHHNLSSNNVLIMAGRRAKITDFGMSKLVGAPRTMISVTMHPGIQEYMPPEALREPPKYSAKIDCFSEGVIMIQMCTQLRPNPGPSTRFVPSSTSLTGTVKEYVPETERRKNHIDLISPTHPLLPIALDCLRDKDVGRPSSVELCARLAGLKETREYRESMEKNDGGWKKGTELQSEVCTWDLHGVEACGEKTVVVYSFHAQQITWEGFGLKLHIQEGSLPAGMEQCILQIKASLAGQYEFPENSHLVSAIFWLRCETVHKFTKPITVEIQHCAKSENVTSLNLGFVRAICSQKQLPYTFKQLPGGNFTSHSSYGVVEVNSFSGVGVVENGADSRNYLASVLYKEISDLHTCCIMEIYIVVIWNLDAHCTVMNTHDRFKDAQLVTDQPIRFKSDRVKFIISNMPDKWRIKSINSPEIMKTDVDDFTPGKTSWIPYSMFKAKFSADVSLICDLECDVDIEGALHPHNKFAIDISPRGHAGGYVLEYKNASPESVKQHTKLTDHHHATLLKQLSIHAAKWRELGTYLGFKQGELDKIQSNMLPSTDFTTSCLTDMLTKWLQWAPGDSRGSTSFATLEALKAALNEVGFGVTALELTVQPHDIVHQ